MLPTRALRLPRSSSACASAEGSIRPGRPPGTSGGEIEIALGERRSRGCASRTRRGSPPTCSTRRAAGRRPAPRWCERGRRGWEELAAAHRRRRAPARPGRRGRLADGRYRLTFDTGAYFRDRGEAFYPGRVVHGRRHETTVPLLLALRLQHLSRELTHDLRPQPEQLRQARHPPGEGRAHGAATSSPTSRSTSCSTATSAPPTTRATTAR